MRKPKTIMTGVAVLATLTLPLVAGAANKLVVNGTDGVTPKMVVTDTGWVGSGTSAPLSPIHVEGSSTVANSTNSTEAGLTYLFTATGSTPLFYMAPNFSLYRKNDVSTNGGRPRLDDALGYFSFGSTIGQNKAVIYGTAETAWTSDTDTPAYVKILSNPGSGLGNREILRLSSKVSRPVATVNGGLRLFPYTGTGGGTALGTGSNLPVKPTCDANTQGTLWFTKATGADSLEICADGALGGIKWRALSIAP